MKYSLFIFTLLFVTSGLQCTQDPASHTNSRNLSSKSAMPDVAGNGGKTSKMSYQIMNAPEKTFGYDIYVNSKILIHQQNVPSRPGNKGFSSKTDAEKVARLVMSKLKKGEMPPTVTIEEMKNMNVIK